jgi:hypothetical protein
MTGSRDVAGRKRTSHAAPAAAAPTGASNSAASTPATGMATIDTHDGPADRRLGRRGRDVHCVVERGRWWLVVTAMSGA